MVHSVGPGEARHLLAENQLDLVDVRDASEWSQGHLPGARHVPLARLREDARAELHRDGVIFVCAAGVRSEAAARLALAEGFSRVYSLSGGTRGWIRAGLPLVKD
ncbi:MAG TPA: rhodanese-like domain-containing protein [Polyangiaceae bacterium]|nr:rhodanese-like domain-containing protein [Polyangiaceae bacterium]